MYIAFTLVLGAVFVIVALVGIVFGIRRLQGHRSRFDRVFELFARTQSAGVFPPSLRGNPDPLEQEVVEVSRADAAARETPGNVVRRRPRRARR